MRKVIRDGKVGILYSPSFGAGWYTWNYMVLECLFSPKIIELVENKQHKLITDEYCCNLFRVQYFCALGANDLSIIWLPVGTKFKIDEFDGSETITTSESLNFTA